MKMLKYGHVLRVETNEIPRVEKMYVFARKN
jgi:hypothetical protein